MMSAIQDASNKPPTSCCESNTVDVSQELPVAASAAVTTKRAICQRCDRPTPRTCICEALPDQPIVLKKCQVVVLQHPHEARRKNRSLPLMELCLDGNTSLKVAVARRFGDKVDADIMKLLTAANNNNEHVILIFPNPDAVSIKEAIDCIEKRKSCVDEEQQLSDHNPLQQQGTQKITIVVLDATWRFAREMERANILHKQYPPNLIRVKIRPNDDSSNTATTTNTAATNNNDSDKDLQGRPASYQPRRFDIRPPPSDDYLSTAECIAWITSVIEEDPSLYDRLMKPLDLMVKKWRSFSNQDSNRKRQTFTDGDGPPEEVRRTSKQRGLPIGEANDDKT